MLNSRGRISRALMLLCLLASAQTAVHSRSTPDSAVDLNEILSLNAAPEAVDGPVRRIEVYRRPGDTAEFNLHETQRFSDDGLLVSKTSYPTASIPLETHYSYTDSGRLHEWYQTGFQDERLWGYRLEYDADGRPVRMVTQSQGGSLEYLEEYLHESSRIPSETVLYNAAGEPVWRRTFEFDGSQLRWEVRQPSGETYSTGVHEYADGRIIREEVRDAAGRIVEKTEYAYDEQGREVEQVVTDAAGEVVQRRTTQYLASSLVFTRIVEPHTQNGSSARTVQHILTRNDSYGNWIERIHTNLLQDNGAVEVVDSLSYQRRITYQEGES